MPRRSGPSRTPSTTSTSTPPNRSPATSEVRPGQAVAERLGLPVRDLALLEQALVHSSWLHEHPDAAPGHNERLEFLGDAVVNLAISEALYARHPDDDEGILSARRAAIVSATGLATLAERIDLGTFLSLGEGEAARPGPQRPSILASAFEALLTRENESVESRTERWAQEHRTQPRLQPGCPPWLLEPETIPLTLSARSTCSTAPSPASQTSACHTTRRSLGWTAPSFGPPPGTPPRPSRRMSTSPSMCWTSYRPNRWRTVPVPYCGSWVSGPRPRPASTKSAD